MGLSIDWDGEGLPPVGLVCEGLVSYGDSAKWRQCEILKHRNGEAAVFVEDQGFLAWCKVFRTPEQRDREELKTAIYEGLGLGLNHSGIANIVWARGFRKVDT